MSMEQFISGFHSRVDKIASRKIEDQLKGHILLRQANLPNHDKHVIIGAASGSYDVKSISAALRSVFRKNALSPANKYGPYSASPGNSQSGASNTPRSTRRHRQRNNNPQGSTSGGASFYSRLGSETNSDNNDPAIGGADPAADTNQFTYNTASPQTKARSHRSGRLRQRCRQNSPRSLNTRNGRHDSARWSNTPQVPFLR